MIAICWIQSFIRWIIRPVQAVIKSWKCWMESPPSLSLGSVRICNGIHEYLTKAWIIYWSLTLISRCFKYKSGALHHCFPNHLDDSVSFAWQVDVVNYGSYQLADFITSHCAFLLRILIRNHTENELWSLNTNDLAEMKCGEIDSMAAIRP